MRAFVITIALVFVAAAAADSNGADPGDEDWSDRVVTQRVILRGLDFAFGTAYIQPVSAGTLEVVAGGLRLRPDVRVRIEGHTDSVGGDPYNENLSLERAEAVKRILVGFGVEPERLQAVGLGESQPIAPNDTEAGRTLNRRVELVLLEKPVEP